jgi:hypothetical protein
MAAPAKGDALYGQDAQHPGTAPSYQDNGDGTVSDLVTGLMWTKSIDLDGSGTIDISDKRSLPQAVAGATSLRVGGYDDSREGERVQAVAVPVLEVPCLSPCIQDLLCSKLADAHAMVTATDNG